MPLPEIHCPRGETAATGKHHVAREVSISEWSLWQLLGTMEEKVCTVADFLNCFQIFKPPLSKVTQTFPKFSVIKPEIKIFSVEGTWSIEACLDK